MSIPRLKLTQGELSLLVYAIDAYLQSLDLPDLFPEHSSKYQHILSDQRLIFFTLATAYRDFDLVMTEPDIIAVDEAVRGFMRICERLKKGAWGYPQAMSMLTRIHEKLEQMKLPPIEQSI